MNQVACRVYPCIAALSCVLRIEMLDDVLMRGRQTAEGNDEWRECIAPVEVADGPLFFPHPRHFVESLEYSLAEFEGKSLPWEWLYCGFGGLVYHIENVTQVKKRVWELA